MQIPKQNKHADSTLIEPNWRKLRMQVICSLCLFGFLLGLMLGKLWPWQKTKPVNQLISINSTGGQLELCFEQEPEIFEQSVAGERLWFIAPVGMVAAESGELTNQKGHKARWLLQWQQDGLLLGLTSIQPLTASWDSSGSKGCIRLVITHRPSGDANRQ